MRKLKDSLVKHSPETRLYQIPVPIIGLTGGIGTGKSTVAELFRKKNIPVIDADKLVKNIYQMPETFAFIKKNFPQAIEEGKILFKKIREIVFINEDAKKLLENYIYSHMPNEFTGAFYQFSDPPFIVYDVPLLFEKKLHLLIDLSVCVYAPREMQIERLMTRDQTTRDLAENILSNQIDIEEKKRLADFVVNNTGSLQELEIEFERLIKDIT
ncbi:MAG: dephospho-CoA kinase [Bacteriovorax sp.]